MALIFNASRILRRCSAAVLAAAIFCAAPLAAHAADSYWSGNAGSTGAGDWGTAGNWDSGVPTVTDNAILPDPLSGSGNYVITLGTNAVAKSLFVQGGDVLATPPAYQFETGTLTLADQLWINSSTVDTFLSIGSGATVVTPNGTVGAAASTNRNEQSVESGGALNVSGQLNVAYEGSSYAGLYVYGSATLGTLNVGGLATANSASVYNYGTLDVGTLVLGDAGNNVYAGFWNGSTTTTGETVIGNAVGADMNELDVLYGGQWTNSGALTLGRSGAGNIVYVGYEPDSLGTGTLTMTGSNDIVIGQNAGANENWLVVNGVGSTLTTPAGLIVGQSGSTNGFNVEDGGSASVGLMRLGVDAGSTGNSVNVNYQGSTLTVANTVRVGDKGSDNQFFINGGTVTLTGTGKNFFVGYEKSANDNRLVLANSGTLVMQDATSDLVISANQGSGADSSGNLVDVSDGGLLDVTRTLVGTGGSLTGDGGTIGGDVLVGAGGSVSPGAYLGLPLGSLSFLGDVDFTNGGTLAIDLGASGTSDFIDVAGSLLLAGSTLDLTIAVQDAGVAYVIAHYGSLSGLFATVNGLPGPSWHVDYNYQGLNEIAIVSDSLVPEIDPSSFGSAFALLMGSLGLIERRTRRVRSFVTAA